MTDYRFYHLEHTTLDKALPSIALKAWESGKHVMIKAPDKKEASRLNDILWSFHPTTFLPHGVDGDKNPVRHPVWITVKDDNVNMAEILILTHGCTHPQVESFSMVCELLDGRVQSQIEDARSRWKSLKDAGHDMTYWQQDDKGKWGKKG